MATTLKSFVHEIYSFLQTVTIYNPHIFEYHQKRIEDYLGVADLLPDENPYFVNMLGECYVNDAAPELDDPRIEILSNDTGEPFYLSRSTLEGSSGQPGHPVTLDNYRRNPHLIAELMGRYPEQTDFIRACFFPVNETMLRNVVAKSAQAPKVTFTYMTDGGMYVLADYEYRSLQQAVIRAVDSYNHRWNITAYALHEKYAYIVMWSAFWSTLPSMVLLQRIRNINTASVHRDLLWLSLASYGLKDYRDVLERDQELFLYRNIRWLKRTIGSKESVRALIKNLLMKYGLTLSEKQIVLESSGMPESMLPQVLLTTKQIAAEAGADAPVAYNYRETFGDIFNRELMDKLEPGYGPDQLHDQEYRIQHLATSRIPTKLLELQTGRYGVRIYAAYCKFAYESLLYWLNLKDANNNPVVDFKIKVKLLKHSVNTTIPIHHAVLLLHYCLHQIKAPYVEITPDNKDTYLNKTVLHQGERIILTEELLPLYQNIPDLQLVGPIDIPVACHFNRPFRSGLPALDYTFKHKGHTYDIRTLIDLSQPRNPLIVNGMLQSADMLTRFTDQQFTIRLKDVQASERNNSLLMKVAYTHLYNQTVLREQCYMDWRDVDDQYNTLDEWLFADERYAPIINELDWSATRLASYEQLAMRLLDAIFLSTASTFKSSLPTNISTYILMRELLTQLISYDVALLNTKSNIFEPVHGFETYIDNELGSELRSQQITEQWQGASSAVIIGTLMELVPGVTSWPGVGEANLLLWRETDSIMVDNIMMDDNDARADVEIVASGSGYSLDADGVIQYDPLDLTDLTPFISGHQTTRTVTCVDIHQQVRHVEPIIEIVEVPEIPNDPYVNPPPEEWPVDSDPAEYDLPIKGVLTAPTEDSVSLVTMVSGGTLLSDVGDDLVISTMVTDGELIDISDGQPPPPPPPCPTDGDEDPPPPCEALPCFVDWICEVCGSAEDPCEIPCPDNGYS